MNLLCRCGIHRWEVWSANYATPLGRERQCRRCGTLQWLEFLGWTTGKERDS